MGHLPLLDELAIVSAIAVAVTVVLSKLKLPTTAGLLAAGALLGPYGLALATSVDAIEVLAEVGVVLLLFSIGLEFSLSRLRSIFRKVALGGAVQVGLTTLVIAGVAVAAGASTGTGVFYGFVFALSSTAIVLRALGDRQELDAPHGRFIVGTLIFQDLCVVPMVLIVPMLGSHEPASVVAVRIGFAIGKALAVVVATLAVAHFAVPKILSWVDASRSREVFLLAILTLCIGTTWLTSMAGLSLALGAFLGGVVVADTEYSHRAMGDILPLRDAFVSIFFISLGMLFDVRAVAAQPFYVLALIAGFLVAKGLLATVAALLMRFPARVALLSGIGLAQFGEFGFVLTRLAQGSGVVTEEAARPLLAAGIVSMFVTPLLVRAAPHFTAGERLLAPLERLMGVASIDELDAERVTLRDHVVVVGFGLAGRQAALALADRQIPFVVLELNAENVRQGKALGLPIYYGDATSEEALAHAHLAEARLLVLLMNDSKAAQRVLATAHRVAANVPILMRTRYLAESEALVEMGAREVVAEEVESAIEAIARMMRILEVPRNLIDDSVERLRAASKSAARTHTVPRSKLGELRGLDELKIETALVEDGALAQGNSATGLRMRSETGALVVGVRRGDRLLEEPDPTVPFDTGDVVYLVGTRDALRRAVALFRVRQVAPGPGE